MRKQEFIMTVLALLLSVAAWGADGDTFTDKTVEGVTMTFKVISEADKTCQVGVGLGFSITPAINKGTTGEITVPSKTDGYTVTKLATNAFFGCSGITDIHLPSTVTAIGSMALDGTQWYNNQADGLVYLGNILYACKGGMDTYTAITLKDGTVGIADNALRERNKVTSVSIPQGVTNIGENAFYGCTSLSEITFPDGITSVGINAFHNTPWLTNQTGIVYIGTIAYSYKGTDTQIEIKDGTKTIEQSCFSGCKRLTDISIPGTVEAIGSFAFARCSSLETVVLPSKLKTLERYVFNDCTSLRSITIPANVTTISVDALRGCTNLSTIAIDPENAVYDSREACNAIIETATNNLLWGCNGTVIPEGVESVSPNAFISATAITEITFPKSIKELGAHLFAYSPNLKSITMLSKMPPTIDQFTFNLLYDNATLYVPAGSKDAYQADENWKQFANITEISIPFHDGDTFTSLVNGMDVTFRILSGAEKTLQLGDGENAAFDPSYAGSFIIPRAVTPDGSFDEYAVTTIGSKAFDGCDAMTSLTVPSSIQTIKDAFWHGGGTGLQKVIVADLSSWCAISFQNGDYSAETSNPLYYAHYLYSHASKKITDLVIPSGVTSTGDYAFAGLHAESVTLPAGCTRIGVYSFYHGNMDKVTIEGELTEIGRYAFAGATIGTMNLPLRDYHSKDGTVYGDMIGYAAFKQSMISSLTIPYGSNSISCNIGTTDPPFMEATIGCLTLGRDFKVNGTSSGYTAPFFSATISELHMDGRLIDMSHFHSTTVTSIYFPEGTLSIDEPIPSSFQTEKVFIPNGVTTMADGVFASCSNLEEITLEASTPPSISSGTFTDYQKANATVNIPAGSGTAYRNADVWRDFVHLNAPAPASPAIAFADAEVKRICVENWDTDGDGELSEDEAAAVTELGLAFKENKTITAFDELRYFTGISEITWECFIDCTALKSITIPANVTSISGYGFANNASLEQITVVAENSRYDSRENCNAIIETETNKLIMGCQTTQIPSSVTTIGENAFWGRWGMQQITIPATVTTIEQSAFAFCTGLETASLPEGISSIGSFAFAESGLASISLPSSLTSISKQLFFNCQQLATVNIPSSVSEIGFESFAGCTALTTVTLGNPTPAEIEENTFTNRTNATLYVPAGSKGAYMAADYWKEFGKIEQTGMGDMNGDGTTTVTDAVTIIDYILGNHVENFNEAAADMNGDGQVTVADVVLLIDLILRKE